MRNTFLNILFLLVVVSFIGCGTPEPGSTVEDTTPGGAPTETISEDPDEVANQMGDDYNK